MTDIVSDMAVWYYNDKEIEVFPTESSAEATIRRVTKMGWTTDVMFDKDGRMQYLGVLQPHSIKVEKRHPNGLIPTLLFEDN